MGVLLLTANAAQADMYAASAAPVENKSGMGL
jgi:hypothetical protein